MTIPPYLDEAALDEVFRTTRDAGLFDRNALFDQIPLAYWAAFPQAPNAIAQTKIDVGRLNWTGPLLDGRIPFRRWLKNAQDLTDGQADSLVFAHARAVVDRAATSALSQTAAALAKATASFSDAEVNALSRHPWAAALNTTATLDNLELSGRADAKGQVDALLAAALAQRTDRPLVALAEARGLLPPLEKFEKIVRAASPMVDVLAWTERLTRSFSTVCRVEVRTNAQWKPAGTGFLVGPDLVMTNHHVIAGLLGPDATDDDVRCRFDFMASPAGVVSQGVTFARATDWLVLSSPPSAADESPDPLAKPAADELDFALLRLAKPAGDLPVGSDDPASSGRRRGWLRLQADSALLLLGEGQNLFVLQHPEGDQMKLANGTFSQVLPLRARYDANTLSGSSGSPCFDMRLDVVALHHAGDVQYPALNHAAFNQGVPTHLISAYCADHGVVLAAPPP